MEFKIDTKPSYSMLTPISNTLDENMTVAISQKWKELMKSGSKNIIVDLHNCIIIDTNVIPNLLSLHDEVYQNGHSIAFTNLQENILSNLKKQEGIDILNITPTLDEASDIINMEILERDLFNEEE